MSEEGSKTLLTSDQDLQESENAQVQNGHIPVDANEVSPNKENSKEGAGQVKPKVEYEELKIFVRDLDSEITQEDLKEYFSKFGEITSLDIKVTGKKNKPIRHGFISFTTHDSVKTILESESHSIKEKTLCVKQAHTKPSLKKLVVQEIDLNVMSIDDVKEYFEKYGKVEDIQHPDKSKGESHYTFTMESEAIVDEILNTSNHTIKTKELKVEKFEAAKKKPKKKRPFYRPPSKLKNRGRGVNRGRVWAGGRGYPMGGRGFPMGPGGPRGRGGGWYNMRYDYSDYNDYPPDYFDFPREYPPATPPNFRRDYGPGRMGFGSPPFESGPRPFGGPGPRYGPGPNYYGGYNQHPSSYENKKVDKKTERKKSETKKTTDEKADKKAATTKPVVTKHENSVPIKIGILTVSDTCSQNLQEDKSGQALKSLIETDKILNGQVMMRKCIPDDVDLIKIVLTQWCDTEDLELVLTTGGTGFSRRDVTPEATKAILEKEATCLAVAMAIKSLENAPLALLSRSSCGIRGHTLIINLPGSVKGSTECLLNIHKVIPHAIDQLRGDRAKVAETHQNLQNHVPAPIPSHEHSKVDPCQVARRERHSPYPLISVAEAQKIVFENALPPQVEPLYLIDSVGRNNFLTALGRILAEPVCASTPLPPFPASVKDGYAVIASDGAGPRLVGGSSTAGDSPTAGATVVPGVCVRVNTGGPVPVGADAVVQVEDTELIRASPDGTQEMEIKILKEPSLGQDIRPVGVDIAAGECILEAGIKLGPSELGLLASCNVTEIVVHRHPLTSVLSTGNELCEPGLMPGPGQIWDSNKTTLMALLQSHGFPVFDAGIARDRPEDTKQKLDYAFQHSDVIVTTGGVSMGEKDILKQVLEADFGAKIHFGRVFMKPGKPTTLATLDFQGKRKLVFALPGNPVSAVVTSLLYVIPCLKKMMGDPHFLPTTIKVKLSSDVKLDPRPEYLRASLEWSGNDPVPLVHSTGSQMSSRMLSLRQANVLVMLPPKSPEQLMVPKDSILDALVIGPV